MKHITFVEDIQIVIACIYVKIISHCPAGQFEKMQISFVCFLKTIKILITFLTTRVSRHDDRTVQKTLHNGVVEGTQFCCDSFDLTKELWEIQIGV